MVSSELWYDFPRTRSVFRPNIKMRPLSIVAHEERAAVFQSTIYMYDGNAASARVGHDAIARLQNETACFHDGGHFAPICVRSRAWRGRRCVEKPANAIGFTLHRQNPVKASASNLYALVHLPL